MNVLVDTKQLKSGRTQFAVTFHKKAPPGSLGGVSAIMCRSQPLRNPLLLSWQTAQKLADPCRKCFRLKRRVDE